MDKATRRQRLDEFSDAAALILNQVTEEGGIEQLLLSLTDQGDLQGALSLAHSLALVAGFALRAEAEHVAEHELDPAQHAPAINRLTRLAQHARNVDEI